MSGINLLPPELKQETKRAKLNTLVVTACLYLLLLFLFGSIALESGSRLLSVKLSQKELEIRKVEGEIENFKDVEESTRSLNDVLQVVGELEKNQVFWSSVLREIAVSTPARLKITNLVVTTQKSPNFNINGEADSPREAAKFREKLEASPYFFDSNFVSATRAEAQDRIFYVFNITVDLEKKKEPEKK